MSTFAERLRELRLEKNILQAELASVVEVSGKTISSYEQGNSEPSIKVIIKFAEYFGVTVDYLLGYSDYRKKENQESNVPLPEKMIELLRSYNTCIEPTGGKTLAEIFGALISDDGFQKLFTYVIFYLSTSEDKWAEMIEAIKHNDPNNPLYSNPASPLPEEYFKSSFLNMVSDEMKKLVVSLQARYPDI